ncbi:MAG: HEPN domain-containing protein [Synechococcus sp.]|nr:HEPN domain-containing protein [Synechococcus sp.]
MTPRVEAWIRQAQSDLAVARLTAAEGFHAQACYHAGQAAEKALKAEGLETTALELLPLKALTRMNSETRYPQDGEAPVDRFDAHDSAQALTVATGVLNFAKAALQDGR